VVAGGREAQEARAAAGSGSRQAEGGKVGVCEVVRGGVCGEWQRYSGVWLGIEKVGWGGTRRRGRESCELRGSSSLSQ